MRKTGPTQLLSILKLKSNESPQFSRKNAASNPSIEPTAKKLRFLSSAHVQR